MRVLTSVALFVFAVPSLDAQSPQSSEVLARVGEATAIILSGEGAGRLTQVSTGVFIRRDGVLLTSYHAVKGAREVQVRLKSGEVFDRVVLLGADERRGVAALKISALNVATLTFGTAQGMSPGDPVYVVAHSNNLTWSATQGIIAASRMADEVPGAGQGYRLLQFTAQLAASATGGPLVDKAGNLVGIITLAQTSGVGFAVPVESVAGLADGTANVALGVGTALSLPQQAQPQSSTALANIDQKQLLRQAKTLFVHSRTTFFNPEMLQRELSKQAGFPALKLVFVNDMRLADLQILVNRPVFTYTFTYSIVDRSTSIVLFTGKVTAVDGNAAAGKIAKALVSRIAELRNVSAVKTN